MTTLGLSAGFAWLWLVLVPVSGWLVLQSRFLRHHFWRVTDSDRYFLIVSTGLGMVVFGIAISCVISAAAMLWPKSDSLFMAVWQFPLNEKAGADFASFIKLALFWSAPIAVLAGWLVSLASRCVIKKETMEIRRAEFLAEKNGMLNFISRTDKEYFFLLLTLSNRKVYVGWARTVSDWNNPNPDKQYVYFLPFMSGFRRQNSLDMKITKDYIKPYVALKKESPEIDEKEFEILLPVHEIVHVQPFDAKLYARHENLFSLSAPEETEG